MGARPYLPSIGRFLAQDPVDGGSANAYDYVSGDPVNGLDLTGMAEQLGPSPATCIDLQPYVEEIVMSTECKVMREARFRENAGVSFDYNATVPYSEGTSSVAASVRSRIDVSLQACIAICVSRGAQGGVPYWGNRLLRCGSVSKCTIYEPTSTAS
jgi:hypothetical protein